MKSVRHIVNISYEITAVSMLESSGLSDNVAYTKIYSQIAWDTALDALWRWYEPYYLQPVRDQVGKIHD